jgi:hypothetical protein
MCACHLCGVRHACTTSSTPLQRSAACAVACVEVVTATCVACLLRGRACGGWLCLASGKLFDLLNERRSLRALVDQQQAVRAVLRAFA